MHWKKFAADYLAFSRRDRIAILTLLVLILGVYFLPQFIPAKTRFSSGPDTALMRAISRLEERSTNQNEFPEEFSHRGYPADRNQNWLRRDKRDLFPFDPNTINEEDWKKLGLRDKTIITIRNYLARGGKFRKPEDLKRVYGLFEDEYERLAPFIKIGNRSAERGGEEKSEVENKPFLMEAKPPFGGLGGLRSIEINSADTAALIALPGIGSKLASRIINFRDKLGGFYSVEQVGETFGLADSTFQKIKPYLKVGGSSIKKIKINTVTLDELKAHPYIRYSIAGPIVAYRNEHGVFKKVEDLKNVMAVTDEVFRKIEKYVLID